MKRALELWRKIGRFLRGAVRRYFGFSAVETSGFLILLPLMGIFIFSEPVYRWWVINYEVRKAEDPRELEEIIARWKWAAPADSAEVIVPVLFSFDPNTASEREFLQLGLSSKVASRIVRYRIKGGKFRIKNDFSRIYGMDSTLADRLNPWINLPARYNSRQVNRLHDSVHFTKTPRPPKELFDLNNADTTQFKGVYGIGPTLSKRLIAYRERLGGFVSMEQLEEVYGLDSTAAKNLRKNSFIAAGFMPRQVDLNLADKKQLTGLPYIKFNVASAIISWRFQHGSFKSIEELRQIVLINEVIFQKIKPYLTVKE